MFRHHGKKRTLKHNLNIASLLSFVAGIVNVAGFLSVQRLTTNVTGHFAFFVDELFKLNWWQGLLYFLYIFSFFLGSFVSNLMVELISRRNASYIYVIPALLESTLLFAVGLFGASLSAQAPNSLAFCLLFAMGLQNSLVTQISSSTVRTTHLTGLFTDLGIELSQLFFYKRKDQQKRLYAVIRLRMTIISFFFLGGILGGVIYSYLGLYVLIIAAITLLYGVIYDSLKFRILLLRRRFY